MRKIPVEVVAVGFKQGNQTYWLEESFDGYDCHKASRFATWFLSNSELEAIEAAKKEAVAASDTGEPMLFTKFILEER